MLTGAGVVLSVILILTLIETLLLTFAHVAGANPYESVTDAWVDVMYLGVLTIAWWSLTLAV